MAAKISTILDQIRGRATANSAPKHTANMDKEPKPSASKAIKPDEPIKTTYQSNPISIPDDFLTATPRDAQAITISPIDFATTVLPEYKACYAVVLDNVISPSECQQLLRLAESSVHSTERGERDVWQPALVNIGGGYEVLTPEYRNSDRIIWDRQEIVDRLWQRCLAAPGLKERLEVIEQGDAALWPSRASRVQRWEFRRLNNRMRFLRYGKGQFFRPHCDAPYSEPGKDIKTIFTVHLYLNDSKQTVGDGAELRGGATSFLSRDESRKMDVDPKAGRVLVFQHKNLYHSGDDVIEGVKYTMRTDILYELVDVPAPVPAGCSVTEDSREG